MKQEEFGNFIKEIRKKHNLTQKEFADSFGVTYQAVSKWENGKNMPDLLLLKEICNKYDMSVDEFLDSNIHQKRSYKSYTYILLIIIIILLSLLIYFAIKKHSDDFEFKTLSSTCENFTITGSIAYNENKGSIYISHITYCGSEFKDKYKKLKCSLYEKNGVNITELDSQSYEGKAITLEDFLKDISFNIHDFNKTCSIYSENNLYLEIEAPGDNGYLFTHKIPLKLEDSCKK